MKDVHTESYFLSLRGICSNVKNDRIKGKEQLNDTEEMKEESNDQNKAKERLNRFVAPLAEAYIEICVMQEQQFYGLRDFYRFAQNRTCTCALMLPIFISFYCNSSSFSSPLFKIIFTA